MAFALFSGRVNPTRELETIFRGSDDPTAQALTWGKQELDGAGLDAGRNPLGSIKHLRQREPALDLATATYLVRKLKVSAGN